MHSARLCLTRQQEVRKRSVTAAGSQSSGIFDKEANAE